MNALSTETIIQMYKVVKMIECPHTFYILVNVQSIKVHGWKYYSLMAYE